MILLVTNRSPTDLECNSLQIIQPQMCLYHGFWSWRHVTLMRPSRHLIVDDQSVRHTYTCTVGRGRGHSILMGELTGSSLQMTCCHGNPSLLPPVDSTGKLLMSFQSQRHYIIYTQTDTHTPTHTAVCSQRVNGIYCYCDNLGVQQWLNVAEIRLF